MGEQQYTKITLMKIGDKYNLQGVRTRATYFEVQKKKIKMSNKGEYTTRNMTMIVCFDKNISK